MKFKQIIYTGDLNYLNEYFGLVKDSIQLLCLYYTSLSQTLEPEKLKTIESLMKLHNNCTVAGALKTTCKIYDIKKTPLFKNRPLVISTIELPPSPSLYVMLGKLNNL